MAIYRLEAKIIGRSGGQSAVGAAAYRSGRSILSVAAYRASEKLHDQTRDITFDYSRKQAVEHSEILAPDHAPEWASDRQSLWNAVEAREDQSNRPGDAQLAREVLVTLPRELGAEECIALVRAFVRDEFVGKGMVADVSVHRPMASDGGEQPHAHILLTMRRIEDGQFTSKAREWNWRVKDWRVAWQDHANSALREAGSDARIDHRSLEARGINRAPQPKQGVSMHAQSSQAHHAARRAHYAQVNHQNRVQAQARAIERLREGKRLPPGVLPSYGQKIAPQRTRSLDAGEDPRRRRRVQANEREQGFDV